MIRSNTLCFALKISKTVRKCSCQEFECLCSVGPPDTRRVELWRLCLIIAARFFHTHQDANKQMKKCVHRGRLRSWVSNKAMAAPSPSTHPN